MYSVFKYVVSFLKADVFSSTDHDHEMMNVASPSATHALKFMSIRLGSHFDSS